MALSMEERRILAQIEVRLSEDDPRLARRLAAFGGSGPPDRAVRPRPGRRARLVAAVVVLTLGIATAIVTAVLSALG
jgi:anti-sigma factor RsiW